MGDVGEIRPVRRAGSFAWRADSAPGGSEGNRADSGWFTLPLPKMPSLWTIVRAHFRHAPSQAAVGSYYSMLGQGEQAMRWLDRAARRWPIASVLYYNAVVLNFNDDAQWKARAVEHVKWGASQDCPEALQVLAAFHNCGEGVPLDPEEGRRLVLKAIQLGRHELWQDLIDASLGDGQSTAQVQQAMVYALAASDAGHPQYLSRLEYELEAQGLLPNNELPSTRGGRFGEQLWVKPNQ